MPEMPQSDESARPGDAHSLIRRRPRPNTGYYPSQGGHASSSSSSSGGSESGEHIPTTSPPSKKTPPSVSATDNPAAAANEGTRAMEAAFVEWNPTKSGSLEPLLRGEKPAEWVKRTQAEHAAEKRQPHAAHSPPGAEDGAQTADSTAGAGSDANRVGLATGPDAATPIRPATERRAEASRRYFPSRTETAIRTPATARSTPSHADTPPPLTPTPEGVIGGAAAGGDGGDDATEQRPLERERRRTQDDWDDPDRQVRLPGMRRAEQTMVTEKDDAGWSAAWVGGSITIDGQKFIRISDDEALRRIIRGEPLEGCYVKSLHLGYQTDTWVKPSDIGTTRFLANHFKVPEQIRLDEHTRTIPVLKYREPIRILGCVIDNFSALGVTFCNTFTMRNSRINAPCRLSPPDATDLDRETTVVPPTVFEGDANFHHTWFLGDWRITRARFAGALDLTKVRIQGDLRAELGLFDGTIDASELQVGQAVRVDRARFAGPANFFSADIGAEFSADRARFDGPLSLDRASIGAVNLSSCRLIAGMTAYRAKIADAFILREAMADGPVDLQIMSVGDDFVVSDATFSATLNGYRIKVGNHLRATNAVFHGPASFRDVSTADSADFRRSVFEQEADFRRSTFKQWAIFFGAEFRAGGNFFGARFEGECLFNRDRSARQNWGDTLYANVAKIGGPLIFSGSYFYRKAVFDGVEFPTHVLFNHAYVAEEGSFYCCKFRGRADFSEIRVTQELDFTGSEFSDELNFAKANINCPVDLAQCKLHWLRCSGAVIAMLVVERQQIEHAIDRTGDPIAEAALQAARDGARSTATVPIIRPSLVAGNATDRDPAGNNTGNNTGNGSSGTGVISTVFDVAGGAPAGASPLPDDPGVAGASMQEAIAHAQTRRFGSPTLVPSSLHAEACEAWTILKSSFARRGKLDDEDWAYAHLKRSQRQADELRLIERSRDPNANWTWPQRMTERARLLVEKVVFDWFTEYGTNPLRTFFLALIAIVAFGCAYTFCDVVIGEPLVWEGDEFAAANVEYADLSLVQRFALSMYFSFMAFTTVGFGDVHPNYLGWVQYLAAIESFLGVFLMTLFVGTYARKIIR